MTERDKAAFRETMVEMSVWGLDRSLAEKVWRKARATAPPQTPPLWEECPECRGSGQRCVAQGICGYPYPSEVCTPTDNCGEFKGQKCPLCQKGRIPIYYTPAAWIAWHEENGLPVPVLDGDTAVWWTFDTCTAGWVSNDLKTAQRKTDWHLGINNPEGPLYPAYTVLNLPGQPRPRDGWRSE